jgi:hypothetical protein
MSPSGKAPVFGSDIQRFESFHPRILASLCSCGYLLVFTSWCLPLGVYLLVFTSWCLPLGVYQEVEGQKVIKPHFFLLNI